MLFVTQLRVLPGQWEDATRLFKHPKLPNNVMVHEFLGLLGKPDAIVIFEAPDASTAADFMVQFSRVTDATTSHHPRPASALRGFGSKYVANPIRPSLALPPSIEFPPRTGYRGGSAALAVPVECPSEREKRRGRRGGRGVAAPAHHREPGSQRFGRRPAPHDIKGLLYAREIPMLEWRGRRSRYEARKVKGRARRPSCRVTTRRSNSESGSGRRRSKAGRTHTSPMARGLRCCPPRGTGRLH